jgi:formate/nitrite transporter FocA (FNT family)
MIGTVFPDLGPATRVCIAAVPFAAALLLRLILGRNRLTGSLIVFTIGWFAMNVLLAPSSEPMRQSLYSLPGRLFR